MDFEIARGLPEEVAGDAAHIAEEMIEQEPDDRFSDDETLPIFDLRKLDGPEPPEIEWVLPGFIPEREVGLLTGAGGEGKSLLAQQLANCTGTNSNFAGVEVQAGEYGASLYVTCEEGEAEMHRRQRRIMRALGLSRPDIHDLVFLSSLRGDKDGTELVRFNADGEAEPTQAYRRLLRTVIASGAEFVVLDNIAHLFGGNENDRRQATAFVNLLYRIVKTSGCTILLIGHPNKSGDPYSGSTAWLNAVRFHLELTRVEDASGFAADPDARVLKVGKANYARKGEELHFRWHNGAFVREEDLPADYAAELSKSIRVNGENDAFLSCLRTRAEQGEGRLVGPSPGPNYAPTQFEGMTEAKGLKRASLKRAMERLFTTGQIEAYTYRNKAKGREVTVLRETSQISPNPHPERLPNTSPELPRTVHPNDHPHTPISKKIEGAAFGSPAPLQDEEGAA